MTETTGWLGVPAGGPRFGTLFLPRHKSGLGNMEIILLRKVQLFCLNVEHAQRPWNDRGMEGGLVGQQGSRVLLIPITAIKHGIWILRLKKKKE